MLSHLDPSSRVRVDTSGRIVIPSDVRARLHIEPGDELIVAAGDDALELQTYRAVVRRAQAAFAPYRVPGHSVVDELLADRRVEAVRDDAR
jgi:AbrB family looped-hinge helix DNA binding protein